MHKSFCTGKGQLSSGKGAALFRFIVKGCSEEWQTLRPGVNYIKAVELPGATMVIRDSNLAIEDSVFSGLSFFGQGAIVLSNSNITFLNATFTANNNSAGAQVLPIPAFILCSKAARTAFQPSSKGGIVRVLSPPFCQQIFEDLCDEMT